MIEHPYPKGTRVAKRRSEPGDGHKDGAQATVEAVIGPRWGSDNARYGYFVIWDDFPHPVFITAERVEAID